MFIKKHRTLSIVFVIGLLFGTIAMTPINAFAESPDFATNIQIEGANGNLDEIQEEDSDESSDEVQEDDSDGSSDEVQEDDSDGSSDNIQGEDDNESLDEVQGEDADGSSDEILDADVEGEIAEDFPAENTDIISGEAINEVSKSTAKQTSGLSVTVEYPEQIQCKTPITFTVNADGGSGDYQYRIHSIMTSELVSVYDVSWGSNSAYQDSNSFSFTFHASGTYYVRFSVRDKNTNQFKSTGLYDYKLNIQDPQYPSVEQIVENTVAECEQSCTSDFEKAVWLHDWILDHADYDHSYSYCSAEGVLARGLGTCESYHKAYVMLLNKAGIATGRVEGNGHVWTAVRMDGQWYQVDSTWDDMGANYKGTYYEHMYFGLTDNIMGLVHSDHTSATPGYESTSLENNYFIKTGMITQWSDPFVELVKQNLANGKTEFSLPVTNSMPDNYKNVIYNLVAYQLSNQSWDNMEVSASYKDSVITVKASAGLGELSSLTITPPAKVLYEKGTAVDTTGLTVTANYINGSRILHEDEYQIKDFDTNTVGARTATITFGGKSATFHYTVQERTESGNVYNGIDYSAVYDYTYYVSKYADLKRTYGDDKYKALEHFVKYGMGEGRQAIDSFAVHVYQSNYWDLQNAYGDDLKLYYLHYIDYGRAEGRNGKDYIQTAPSTPTGDSSIYEGIDYSKVYDYSYYINHNPDIYAVLGDDPKVVLKHFVEFGMSEGRQAIDSFNVHIYRERYFDLNNAFGDDMKAYYIHYIDSGYAEGRDASENSSSIHDGIDYSLVYDYDYYVANNQDVANVYGNNRLKVLEHFVSWGMTEGRQAKETFNVRKYMNRYFDLPQIYGNDLKSYYYHYINYGNAEGRIGN